MKWEKVHMVRSLEIGRLRRTLSSKKIYGILKQYQWVQR